MVSLITSEASFGRSVSKWRAGKKLGPHQQRLRFTLMQIDALRW